MSLSWEWSPALAGAAAAAAAAAALAWHWRRAPARGWLLGLRAAAALLLALAALRPTVAFNAARRSKPGLLVLVDAGHAMAAGSGRPGLSRLGAAVAWLKKHRRALEARCDVHIYALSDRGRALASWEALDGLETSAAGFDAAAALGDVADAAGGRSLARAEGELSQPPERAWLLSDGNAEPDGELGAALAELGLPVDVLGVGPSRRGQGAFFSDLRAPDFAFLHGRLTVETALEASALAGKALELRLLKRRADPSGGWARADRVALSVASDFETLRATFTAEAESLGAQRFRLEARAGEALLAAKEFRIEVIRQKYRIMYLSGRPSAEYANLREFLKSEPNHELVSFVILRNPENLATVSDAELSLIPFPAEEIFVRTLAQFDLFILENFSAARFRLPASYLAALKSFVSAGGALLVIGGENAFGQGGYRGSPLEDILPVALSNRQPDFVPGPFRAKPAAPSHPLVQLYDTPEESRLAWGALPELDGYARFASVRPGASVLAVHPEARADSGEPLPIFAVREYGRGKVMLVSSDSTWRWRLGAALDWRAGSFYGRFWTRAVQYLTGSLELSKVKFSPLPDQLPPREPAALRLRVFDESFRPAARELTSLRVLWTQPSGAVREAAALPAGPGRYELELTGLAPGRHRLKAVARYRGKPLGEDEVRFDWAKSLPEAPMDRRWLLRTAQAAGGEFRELDALDVAEALAKLSPVRVQAQVLRRTRPWDRPWWLALLLALLLGEWVWRRWRGLP
ncbi:MAG: glutamine amidotransferase [Elusimicrobia bacterium]|nr:glutamine amidotransferase [Elusimicrobiota bacterium]